MNRFRIKHVHTVPQLVSDLQDANKDVDRILKAARLERRQGGGNAVKVVAILAVVALLIVVNLCAFYSDGLIFGLIFSAVIVAVCCVATSGL